MPAKIWVFYELLSSNILAQLLKSVEKIILRRFNPVPVLNAQYN